MAKPARQRTLPGFESLETPAAPPDDVPTDAAPTDDVLGSQTVYVVDAHSLIYQVFHALGEMTGPQGQPVGAIHGFTRDLLDLLENRRPNYLFCAFDHPSGETFRHTMYTEYKAQREAMPDDLRPQIADIQRMLGALGIPVLQRERYEADDILATVAHAAEQRGGACFLVTSDKDCLQLITDSVKIYNPRKNLVCDAAWLHGEWGIRPDQVVDYQSLVGDSVDNVPGVPLIGPKLARQLLTQYDSLDEVLQNAEQVSGKKRRENLIRYREQAQLSRELVRLDRDVPLDIDWQAGRVGGIDRDAALELCQEFGFRRLADRVARLTVQQAPPRWQSDYQIIDSPERRQWLVDELKGQARFSLDTETTSASPRWAEIVGLSFSWREGEACYVPLRAPEGEPRLEARETLEALRPVLEDPAIGKIGQNLKYDVIVLRAAGIQLAGVEFDTMVADYLLDAGQRNHGLDDLALRYLNHTTIKIKTLIGSGKAQKRMDEVPVAQVARYAAEDADLPLRLAGVLGTALRRDDLEALFRELEMPLIDVLADMEYTGIKVDGARLAELGARFGKRLDDLKCEIHELAGRPFNIDSRQQLAQILFEELKLPVKKRTKTGPSTDADVLEELADEHALPRKIIAYRQLAKLKGTYIDALPALVHPETGRVHTSFKQDVAATGRLSSSEPNLQNIPVRSAEGREIRSAFLPGDPAWQLLAADYSQIELRVLAHYAQDEALQAAFLEDRDIHAQVASEVYGVELEGVTREMRRSAKAVNFGVIYGQGARGLAQSLGISRDEAATFIDAYFDRYAGVEKFIRKVLENCRKTGYVNTILGRRRTIQGIRDPSRAGSSRHRNLPERIAINTVIQGSAADLIKRAMIHVSRRLRRDRLEARMLLQIHDELVFEVPSPELPLLSTLVTQEMTSAARLSVPLKVDVRTGADWAACE